MKNLICVLAVLFISISSFAQSFEKLEKDENVTKVVVSKGLFSLIGKVSDKKNLTTEDKKVMDFIDRIKSFKMYTSTGNTQRNEMKAIAGKYRKSKEFEELMRINDGGKEVEFLVKTGKKDEISELIMFVEGSGDNESVIFQLSLS
ncbi:DUF4252 domain-containing protein [Flavobacterium azooxidireducens]|uniref:DUF4252 domain-containing protein n=1 Tax=Flavobacterium azooxidireducens TaxID=1871076 RepID=A0ABY4KHF2_9FLAO|nr:DUF4252 domain-containing protein [Flavobacterium azooxidireducens]UPQ78862.1 DUF4252 domain-containing protein [Flavobacterium azooxidireducens]